MLRCVAGLLPFEGQVLLNEKALSQYARAELARHIAVVPQQFHPAFRMSVRDFLLTGRFPYLNWLGQYQSTDYQLVDQWLERLSLSSFRDRSIQELSGGEQQKVLLGRALCQETPVLLLDEPAQSLDPFQRNWLYQILTELAGEGKKIVCATHDLTHLHQENLSVVALKSGKILFQVSGSELENSLISEVYR